MRLKVTRGLLFWPAGRVLCHVPLVSFQMSELREKRTKDPTVKRQENKDSARSQPE